VNCSVTLTYHKRDRRMLCHYCNYATQVPERCPKCAERVYLQFIGVGSERLEEELHREFPEGSHRAAGSRYGRRQARLRDDPAGLSRAATTTFWWARR
jgi:primosomal protein N'